MRRACALFAIALALALPGNCAQRVTVEQLERILTEAQGMPDNELAEKLVDLRLTERMTPARLARWRARVQGARSQRALTGLADRSAFLEVPATEIPATPTPEVSEQRRIMGLAAKYVAKAIPQLPRFYATRTITHFEDAPGSGNGEASEGGGSLHAVRISSATVMYRDGAEVTELGPMKVQKTVTPDRGLRTWGAFGPILGLVLVDAAQNKLVWGHWERSEGGGTVAVFRYGVPKEKSHYEVRYCCVATSFGLASSEFQQMSAYHGQIAVDPASGSIVRLTLEADLNVDDPISRAAIAVEYGPQELGGVTYICPSQSVSISVAKTLRNVKDSEGRDWPAMGPPQMLLNHVVFDQYHLFRAETRVLSASEERAAGVAPDATLVSSAPAEAGPTEEVLTDAPAVKTADGAGRKPVIDAGTGDENAEISTKAATGLPDLATPQPQPRANQPEQAGGPQASGYTLRVNARLVDVNVVALDKKGQPITNLKPGDFEVYDNGVKQDVRSFSQADADAGGQSPAPENAASHAQVEFSNHATADTSADGNTIVLMIDASNLAYPDLVDARLQVIHFLRALPSSERVALYVCRYRRFQVLEEASTDHAMLVARLQQWRPSAQDVGNAGDEEQRNRQQFETVHSPEDMLSVNGNSTMDTFTQFEPLDPKMREMGSSPGPNALSILVDVAHHLAVTPGHKSLIWVTSDNALADWNKLSITYEKGSKFIEPVALRAQEAMNNAHVSVYPLDASKLEGAVVSPELGRRNVELTPTFQRPLSWENQMEGPEATAGQDMNPYIQNRNFAGAGRLAAQMQQDTHPIQGVFREVAEATGGRALRRSNNMVGQLNGVVADGHATYLLGFSPSQPADGQYHLLTVKLVGKRDATLRYRTGYEYDKEPATLKDRFKQAIWQANDASQIAVKARPVADAAGNALRITVAGTDLDLSQQNTRWMGKLDIFLVRRDEQGLRAAVSGKTVGLRLKPATYQRALKEGLTFDERLEARLEAGTLRVIVVDGSSGRIGSVTVPTTALHTRP